MLKCLKSCSTSVGIWIICAKTFQRFLVEAFLKLPNKSPKLLQEHSHEFVVWSCEWTFFPFHSNKQFPANSLPWINNWVCLKCMHTWSKLKLCFNPFTILTVEMVVGAIGGSFPFKPNLHNGKKAMTTTTTTKTVNKVLYANKINMNKLIQFRVTG